MSPIARLRSRLQWIALGTLVGSTGCGYRLVAQEEVCFDLPDATVCPSRDELARGRVEGLSRSSPDALCNESEGGELVSVDEGPVEKSTSVYVAPGQPSTSLTQCCYLVTCDQGTHGAGTPPYTLGHGRPLRTSAGPLSAPLLVGASAWA